MATSYEDTLRRRLGVIQDQGVAQTDFIRQRAEQQRQIQAAQQEAAYRAQLNAANNRASSVYGSMQPNLPDYQPGRGGGGKGGKGGKPSTSFEAFMQAIAKQESGGNYGAVNKDSGASGKYQIMPSNIGNWSREALGKSISRSQFLGSPELQDKIARFKLAQYYKMYGAAGAAVAWYAGPGNARRYVKAKGRGYNKAQGNYPSVSGYVAGILAKMGL